MQICSKVNSLQEKINNKTTAFVPTMGGLHAGHISLVNLAKSRANQVIVSIFVNPSQFAKGEDLKRYPNTIKKDIQLLQDAQVDILFLPSVEEIYPNGLGSDIHIGKIGNILCGASRKGHFKGVVQVVRRLFSIIKPDIAVFGKKDYQQLKIVEQYTSNVEIISGEIVRNKDGLAMSTRNLYLSNDELKIAQNLYKILKKIKQEMPLEQAVKELEKYFKVDYLVALDASNLEKINDTTKEIAILSAVFLANTRLIDNIIFRR